VSSFTEVRIDLKDLGLIKKALVEMGYAESAIEMHASPETLHGYHREDQAHLIIRKSNLRSRSYNDLGFKREANGEIKIIGDSDFVTTRWIGQLKDEYALAMVQEQIVGSGFFINEIDRKSEQIEITLEHSYM